MKTVEQLRKEGHKVRVVHMRHPIVNGYIVGPLIPQAEIQDKEHNLFPRGGATSVEVTTPSGETWSGYNVADENKTFNRGESLKRALGYALGTPVRQARAEKKQKRA